MKTILAFTTDQASCLTGLSARQLQYWASTGFFEPSYANEARKPYGRVYSFRDVVGLRVLSMLRNEHRLPLQGLRKVGEWLEERYGAPWSSLRFYVKGRDAYFDDPDLRIRRSGSNPEQIAIEIEMEPIAVATERDARRLRDRDPDEIGRIVRHRYVSHNAPTLAGTRIRTEAIWNFYRAGRSIDDILYQYPRLTPKDVKVAIEFERERRRLAS